MLVAEGLSLGASMRSRAMATMARMVRGFRAAAQAAWAQGQLRAMYSSKAASALADAAGGASGALWGVLTRDARCLTARHRGAAPERPSQLACGRPSRPSRETGRAEVGDKTLIDALDPFVADFERKAKCKDFATAWEASLPSARAGRDATVAMVTRRGRAAALGEKSRGCVGSGAYSLCLVLEAVSASFGNEGHGDA